MARNKNPEVTINRIMDVAWELFSKKGYDNTTIQDIVDALGDLSKGAIYHHFKNKEEIMIAVTNRVYADSDPISQTMTHENLTGLQKLRLAMSLSLKESRNHSVYHMAPNLLKNPQMLVIQMESSMKVIVPEIQLLIEEGIADGSIETNYPKELAEVLILLTNIWITPALYTKDRKRFYRKIEFLDKILVAMGLNLMDEDVKASIDIFANAIYTQDTSS